MKRLLTIGHSYVVAANRRLAHEMAVAGKGCWSVTSVAPRHFRGDLRRVGLEPLSGEEDAVIPLDVRFDRRPHLMWYSGLAGVLAQEWDVVHCWEEPYVLAAAQVAARVRPSARLVIATFQNLSKRYPWPLSAFERRTMLRADGWIAFGETVHAALAGRPGYGSAPSRVIPPGVDIDRFRPDPAAGTRVRTELGWCPEDLVVGFLGRFVEEKGVRVLLDALAVSTAPWKALFVGGGPLEPVLRAFAAVHPGRIQVVTTVPHDGVPAWLNAMTILCAPSQTTPRWREQFGRMLIEAMACGVPIIASDSGEMPFVVGDAALVVAEADTLAWASAIDGLLGDAPERARRAGAGQERAAQRFAWPSVARRHLAFFDAMIEGHAS